MFSERRPFVLESLEGIKFFGTFNCYCDTESLNAALFLVCRSYIDSAQLHPFPFQSSAVKIFDPSALRGEFGVAFRKEYRPVYGDGIVR